MSELACFIIPVKQTASLDFAKKAKAVGRLEGVDASVLDALTKGRIACIAAVERVEKAGEVKPEVYDAATAATSAYLALLAGAMPEVDGVTGSGGERNGDLRARLSYFYWAQCVGHKTSFAADDTLYEAAAVLSNLAFAELRYAAEKIGNANRLNVDKVEKEAYKLCRAAAGKLDTAQRLMMQSTDHASMPLDARPEILEGLKNLALGQAQEMGLAVAGRKEDNKGRELLAKVAAQAGQLYDNAAQVLAPGKGGRDELYERLAGWVAAKRDLMRARAHALNALYFNKENNMEPALRAAAQAEELAGKAAEAQAKTKGALRDFATLIDREARGVKERVERDNSIVGHCKPAVDPVPLPALQELARPDAAWGEHAGPLPPPDPKVWTEEALAAFVPAAAADG